MINIEDHKIYVESHKMDMIPYSIAIQAISQKSDDAAKYAKDLEHAMTELHRALTQLSKDI